MLSCLADVALCSPACSPGCLQGYKDAKAAHTKKHAVPQTRAEAKAALPTGRGGDGGSGRGRGDGGGRGGGGRGGATPIHELSGPGRGSLQGRLRRKAWQV